VNPARVTVFVANDSEKEAYSRVLGDKWRVVTGVPKLFPQRLWYNTNYYPKGTRILNLDDDICSLKVLSGDKLAPYTGTIDRLAEIGFGLCEKHGAKLWGIYPVENAFYLSNQASIGLRYICGIFHGTYAGDKIVTNPKRSQLSSGEDFVNSIRGFIDYGKVVRLDWICPETKYFAEGGIDAELADQGQKDRQIDHTRALKGICVRYSELAKLVTKPDGTVNIRLKSITTAKEPRQF
jgi:hypothetical protein